MTRWLSPWMRIDAALAAAALLFVAIGAKPYAGGWNDGSRLATVESIVDRHTLAIDDSIFCKPLAETIAQGHPPYHATDSASLRSGTLDKLYVGGHYYSEKPAVISLLLAIAYQLAMGFGLPRAAERPDLFCWAMTFVASGIAFGGAIVAMRRLGTTLGLRSWTLGIWLASFAFATFVGAYTRHVNNHIMLLGVVSALMLGLVRIAEAEEFGKRAWGWLVGVGTLAGLGFNLDFGSGPLLVVAVVGCVAFRTRRLLDVGVCLVAMGPWVLAGLGINYAIGGVWKPMNMVPEYMTWPGSPFTPNNLTGFARHGIFQLPIYALALLFGKHGFLNHNLPLLLALPTAWLWLRQRSPERFGRELAWMLGWCVATWGIYALLSNNSGGGCLSIRWFAPFLAPMYALIGVRLAHEPGAVRELAALSVWGAVLGVVMWSVGPWTLRMVPMMWPIAAAAIATWVWVNFRRPKTASVLRNDVSSTARAA